MYISKKQIWFPLAINLFINVKEDLELKTLAILRGLSRK